MRREQYDPLPFDLWLSELGKLSEASAISPADHEDRAVRRAFYLFKLGPPSVQALGDPDLDESAIELLLERGEAERAALLIAGDRLTIAWDGAPAAPRATVTVSYGETMSATAHGNSPALALVHAWADLLRLAPMRALARLPASR